MRKFSFVLRKLREILWQVLCVFRGAFCLVLERLRLFCECVSGRFATCCAVAAVCCFAKIWRIFQKSFPLALLCAAVVNHTVFLATCSRKIASCSLGLNLFACGKFYLPLWCCAKYTIKICTSAGETPLIRPACPRFCGRIFCSFWRASMRRPSIFS